MNRLFCSFQSLNFFFKNWILVQNLDDKFFRDFFSILKKKKGFIFLLLLFWIEEKPSIDIIFFSILISKNFFLEEIQNFDLSERKFFLKILLDFFLCSPKKINHQLEHFLKQIVEKDDMAGFKHNISFSSIQKKLEKKINFQNQCEFFVNLLKVIKVFPLPFDLGENKVLGFFCLVLLKIVSGVEFFFSIKNHKICTRSILEIIPFLRTRKDEIISTNQKYPFFNFIIFMGFKKNHKLKIFKTEILKVKEMIFKFFYKKYELIDEDISLFNPIFLKDGIISKISTKVIKNKNFFMYFMLTMNSANSSTCFWLNGIKLFLKESLLFLNLSDFELKLNFGVSVKIFSFEEKENFISKKKLSINLFKSIPLCWKQEIFEDLSSFFFQRDEDSKNTLKNKLDLIFLFKNLNGTCFSGNLCTISLKGTLSIFLAICRSEEFEKKINLENYFIDFFTFFRYQFPVRFILKFLKKIFCHEIENRKINPHFLNFFDKILSVRGNDGKKILMIDTFFNEKNFTDKIFKNGVEKQKNHPKNRELFFKFFLKLFLNFGIFNTEIMPFRDLKTMPFCDHSRKKKFNKKTILYVIELIILKISQGPITDILGNQIFDFGENIFFNESIDFTFYALEIFNCMMSGPNEEKILKFRKKFLLSIRTRSLWSSKNFPESVLRITISLNKKMSKIFPEEELPLHLTIIEIYLKNFNFDPVLIDSIDSLSEIFSNKFTFIPHLIEICSEKKKNFIKNFSFLYFNIGLFDILTKKIEVKRLFFFLEKLGENFFFSYVKGLIEVSPNNDFLTLIPLLHAIRNFRFLGIFLVNLEGILLRKLIMSLKNFRMKQNTKSFDELRSLIFTKRKNVASSFSVHLSSCFEILTELNKLHSSKINFTKFRKLS